MTGIAGIVTLKPSAHYAMRCDAIFKEIVITFDMSIPTYKILTVKVPNSGMDTEIEIPV